MFQNQVLDHMAQMRRWPYTGPVALDLDFVARRKTPPGIHQLTKHVLDLLGPARQETTRPRRRRVLYGDDRQVKFLHVRLHQAWQPSGDLPASPVDGGTTYVTARPGRDVIADLQLMSRLRRLVPDDDEDRSSPFWSPDIPDDFDFPWRASKPGYPADDVQVYLHEWDTYQYLTQFQEAALAATDVALLADLCRLVDPLPRLPDTPWLPADFVDKMRKFQDSSRELLLFNPMTLPLPGLPRDSGDSREFRAGVRRELLRFKTRMPLFTPLLVPVMVTFMVVPPEQGKDLDNIALNVLPIVHEVLSPHIEPHVFMPAARGHPEPWRDEALTRLRSLNAQSVTSYQVIELPRTPKDTPEGTLRIALGPGTAGSWWGRAADHADKLLEGLSSY